MFIEFQVGNFRSFRDIQKFSMLAAPIRSNDAGLDEKNIANIEGFRFLKTKAIFGGNASGKSNLAKALNAFSLMVNKSVSQEGLPNHIWDDRFALLTDWNDQPITFQYRFLHGKKIYRYGFEILNGIINFEWLFGQKGIEVVEDEYFKRGPGGLTINETFFVGGGAYMEQALSGDNEIFREDSLFLTGAAINGNKLASRLRMEIRKCLTVDGINDENAIQFAMSVLKSGTTEQQMALKRLLRAADVGIEDIEVQEIPESLLRKRFDKESQREYLEEKKTLPEALFSSHKVFDDNGNEITRLSVPFGDWESEGTGKLLGIGALALESLRTGRTLIIDEFDARFHPNLTLKIVQLFNSEKTNPNCAQLIFITHDSGLLKRADLRRDQICLIDKDRYGISTLRTLIEYRGVRKDASYEKEYLQGNYNAVPFLDEMDWVIIQNIEKNGLQKTE